MVTRSALPQNYCRPGVAINSPTTSLTEEFQALDGFTLYTGGKGNFALNNTEYVVGTTAIKATVTTNASLITLTKTSTITVPGRSRMVIRYYLHDTYEKYAYIKIMFDFSADWSKTMHCFIVPSSSSTVGWNTTVLYKEDFTPTGGATWLDPITCVNYGVMTSTGNVAAVTFGSFYIQTFAETVPRVVITCDDGNGSQYSTAFPIMEARGIKGTAYINGYSCQLSLTHLQELYAAGWTIANHGWKHDDYQTKTREYIVDSLTTNAEYLIDNGMPRGAYHHAWPYGRYNSTALLAAHDAGILTARGTFTGNTKLDPLDPLLEILESKSRSTGGYTVAQICANIDLAMFYGQSVFYLFHDIEVTGVAEFTAILDYIVSKGIKTCTIDEWYNGLTNPRYRSLPVGRT